MLNSVAHVAPLSGDFSQICSTLSAFTRTTFTRFSTTLPFASRLGPVNSAAPGATPADLPTYKRLRGTNPQDVRNNTEGLDHRVRTPQLSDEGSAPERYDTR
jgi:hypothetical protein